MIAVHRETGLEEIAAKVKANERLSRDDGIALYHARDIFALGRLANLVRERLHGDAAYYNLNRHINYTNYCVLRCKFCSFYRPYSLKNRSPDIAADHHESDARQETVTVGEKGFSDNRSHSGGVERADSTKAHPLQMFSATEPDTYELPVSRMVELARTAQAAGATEVHIVGGLHPKLPFSYYTEMCSAIRAACPGLHIKAFTAIEIIHFTRITKPRMSIRDVLLALKEAGLGSLPGGGAEIFDDRVHEEAYRNKVGEAGWFDVHRTAHELGVYSNATMLYGHIESIEDRITHMIKLREHQDESLKSRRASFNCFIPLSFIPDGSELAHLPGPTGLDDLRTLAVSRLMLDNFPHIKAFWIMQSAKLSQVSLNWGVDDLDGTVVNYDITKREGGTGNRHQELTVDQIRRLIVEAGRRPVERDTLYRPVDAKK